MTIQEAIKSGKKFRRPRMKGTAFDGWYVNEPGAVSHGFGSYGGSFSYQDLLADDWEIEEKKVEITRDKLMATISKLMADSLECSYTFSISSHAIEKLAKELGL